MNMGLQLWQHYSVAKMRKMCTLVAGCSEKELAWNMSRGDPANLGAEFGPTGSMFRASPGPKQSRASSHPTMAKWVVGITVHASEPGLWLV